MVCAGVAALAQRLFAKEVRPLDHRPSFAPALSRNTEPSRMYRRTISPSITERQYSRYL
jgi:hypothetical protein